MIEGRLLFLVEEVVPPEGRQTACSLEISDSDGNRTGELDFHLLDANA